MFFRGWPTYWASTARAFTGYRNWLGNSAFSAKNCYYAWAAFIPFAASGTGTFNSGRPGC
jgi:hypothetical protein